MGLLRKWFGPSHEQVWAQLAAQINAKYTDSGWLRDSHVQTRVKDWIITLDAFHTKKHDWTRLRAPFANPDGLRFSVERAGILNGMATVFGDKDVEIGVPEFDRDFVIRVHEPVRTNCNTVRSLLMNPRLRGLIEAQPRIYLSIKDDEGRFHAHFPAGVDELYFQAPGVIKNLHQLRSLFDLFAELLHHLCHLSSATDDSVELLIRKLASPGGEIRDGELLLWDGDATRRDAVEGLARLRDPVALPALVNALDDTDPVLRVKALAALKVIGDPRCVPALIAHLGCTEDVEGFPFRNRIISVLREFGEYEVVDAFNEALYGSASGIEKLRQDNRRAVIDALLRALDAQPPKSWQAYSRYSTVVHAAEALAELGAVEALPKLRANSRILQIHDDALKEAWQRAISKLAARAALPRASGEAVHVDTLPRTANTATKAKVERLPRVAEESADGEHL